MGETLTAMNRIAPLLLTLGLVCVFATLRQESIATFPPEDIDPSTLLTLALGLLATCLGGANLIPRRRS